MAQVPPSTAAFRLALLHRVHFLRPLAEPLLRRFVKYNAACARYLHRPTTNEGTGHPGLTPRI